MHLREGRQLQPQNQVLFCCTVCRQVLHLRILKFYLKPRTQEHKKYPQVGD